MLRTTITLLSLALLWPLSGQSFLDEVSVTEGPLVKNKYKEAFVVPHGLGSSGASYFYVARPGNQYMFRFGESPVGTSLGRISPDNRNFRQDMELEEEGKDIYTEYVLMLRNDIYVFSSFQNIKQQKHFLFARPYSTSDLKPKGDLILITEVDYSGFSKYKTCNFNFSLSPDSSKLLVFSTLNSRDGEILTFEIQVMDDHLEQQWQLRNRHATLPQGYFRFDEYCISNEGDVHLLGSLFDDKKEYKDAAKMKSRFLSSRNLVEYPVYSYVMVSYMSMGQQHKTYEFQLPGQFVRELLLTTHNGQVVCSGLYSKEGEMSVRGSCLFVIDPLPGTTLRAEAHPFPEELITRGFSEKDAERYEEDQTKGKEFESWSYYMKPLIPDKKGGFWMVAEQGLYSTRTVRSGSSVTVYDVYTRGDVYVARYSPDYERIFVSKMEKHQKLADAGLNFLSFSAHPYRDRLYLLYNAVTEKEAGMLGFKEFGTRLWAVDAQGNSFEKVLFTNKDMGIDPLARFAGLAGNALMLYGQGKNAFQHRFIRIALD